MHGLTSEIGHSEQPGQCGRCHVGSALVYSQYSLQSQFAYLGTQGTYEVPMRVPRIYTYICNTELEYCTALYVPGLVRVQYVSAPAWLVQYSYQILA